MLQDNVIHNFNLSFGPKQQTSNAKVCYKETPESNISLQSEELLSPFRDNSPQNWQRKKITYQNSFNTLDKQHILQLQQTLRPKAQTSQIVKFLKVTKTMGIVQRFKSNLFLNAYILPKRLQEQFKKQEKYTNTVVQNDSKKRNLQSKQIPLISPSSPISQIFDMLSIIVQLIALWIISIMAVFTNVDDNQAQIILFIIVFLVFELIFLLNRAIIIQGLIIEDRSIIFQNFVKQSSFLYSLEIIICVYIQFNKNFLQQQGAFLLVILLAVIIGRILQQYDNLIDTLYQLSIPSDLLDLITLIISIYYFAHFIACCWLYCGLLQEDNGSWITYYELSNQNIWIKYSTSFYWATMTMVTVGYGDITPKNQTEMIFCDIAMFLSSCVFAYSMNSIGIILKNINDKKVNYKKRAIILNQYMKKNDISNHIQDKVRNYLKYQIENEYNEIQKDAIKILKQLPKGIEQEISQNINNRILQKIKVFDQFTKWTKSELIDKIELVSYTPGEYIYHQDTNQNIEIYYVYQGSVDIVEEQSQQNIQQLKQGEVFGEFQFFTGFNPKTSAISNGFSIIAKIKRETFIKILQDVKKDQEKFHQIKDKILLYNDYSDLMISCKFCKKISHIFYLCPMLTYQPDMESRLKKEELYPEQQDRQPFKRGILRKKNSLLLQKETFDNIKEYQEINGIDQIEDNLQSEIQTNSLNEEQFYPINENQQSMKNINLIPKNSQMMTRTSRLSINQNHFGFCRQSIAQTSKDKYNIKINQNQLTISNHNSPPKNINESKNIMKWNMLDSFIDQLQFHYLDIDSIQEYEIYMKHNNFKQVIKELNQKPKYIRKLLKLQKYTFNYYVKVMAIKIREYLDDDEIIENVFSKSLRKNQ
ncbi:unnamed protein product [Paramecium primaurelia]|uniref:Cyclic nucleotide-binding domain-containing protein n=1 Tax=Paramecium primaurelia TaxID=5886 RepID=A0A8S1KUD9_PARPR|nr:unnamed protein product [Paramecium primaurelia]